MNNIIIDSYLNGSYNEKELLTEAISVKDLVNKTKAFKELFSVILKMKNKKGAVKFLKKNSIKIQKVIKYITKNFDPFEDSDMDDIAPHYQLLTVLLIMVGATVICAFILLFSYWISHLDALWRYKKARQLLDYLLALKEELIDV